MYSDVYIVFEKATVKTWWTWLLHKQISHCYIIKPFGDAYIIYGKSSTNIELYTIKEISDIINKSTVIKVKPGIISSNILMLNTCVSTVKQYLGIKNPLIFTPYQLYRNLKNG